MAADVSISEIKDRALSLYEALISDPDRPYWQVELTAIVLAHADIMSLLSSDFISSCGDLSALKERITSLETRYSDLLYRMASRT